MRKRPLINWHKGCFSSGINFYPTPGAILNKDYQNKAKFCNENGFSTEEGARRLRYQAFEALENTDKIATAHTMSDNAETVVLNLARGSSLDGLCGIPPVRGKIIRRDPVAESHVG